MRQSLFLLLALFIAISEGIYGQHGGGSTGGPAGRSNSGSAGNGLAPPPVQPPLRGLDASQVVRPVFLSGRVALADGEAPPDSVIIQRVCNGYTRNEAWTDSKGRFGFQLGKQAADLQDVSQDPGHDPSRVKTIGSVDMSKPAEQPETNLSGCSLQAYLPGFRSESIMLSSRDALDRPDVGTIFMHRMAEVQGQVVSATTLMAPKAARKLFDKGESAAKNLHWEEASRDFRKALVEYPNYAAAWYGLGQSLQQTNDPSESVVAYKAAVKADAKFLKPYEQLVMLQVRQEQWDDALRYSAEWIRIDPVDFPEAYLLNALANLKLNRLDDAERSAREGYRLDKQQRYPRLSYLLGFILAQKHAYGEAASYFRNYVKLTPDAPDARVIERQAAALESSAGRRPAPLTEN